MSNSTVRLDVNDGVATITLDRPERLGAFDIPMAHALSAAAAEAAASDAEVVVLTGTGRAFSAGGDARAMADAEDPAAFLDELVVECHRAMTALRALPQPLIARVNGIVAGGGMGMLLTSDLAIAADTARFTPAYPALAFAPDCGASVLLPEAVGMRRAKRYLLGAEVLDAATALEWGLLSAVVAPEDLDEATAELVARVRHAGGGAREAKALINNPLPYAEQLEAERGAIVRCIATAESQSRLAAFRDA